MQDSKHANKIRKILTDLHKKTEKGDVDSSSLQSSLKVPKSPFEQLNGLLSEPDTFTVEFKKYKKQLTIDEIDVLKENNIMGLNCDAIATVLKAAIDQRNANMQKSLQESLQETRSPSPVPAVQQLTAEQREDLEDAFSAALETAGQNQPTASSAATSTTSQALQPQPALTADELEALKDAFN